MASITATEIQPEPNRQTTSSVSTNNLRDGLVTHRFTVNRFVRDPEDLLETTFYPGQSRALYITNNVAPGWLLKSQTVTLCSEYPEQPASASQQLVFIDPKTLGALRELAKEHFKIEPTLHL